MKPGYHKMPDGHIMKNSEMMEYKGKSMQPGGGGQFAKLEDAFGSKGIKDPGALAAALGREKYGKEKFQDMAANGLRRHWRNK